ncbi:MAG: Na+/H+ antiporter NhaC family protein [Alloprevotella sp.]|nr:Na+/H+ antiporter NhaC family protein [Alloprevotella sp.]
MLFHFSSNKRTHHARNGLLALSPLLALILVMGSSAWLRDGFGNVSLTIVFLVVSAYALCTLRGWRFDDRLKIYSHAAGSNDLLLMVWIFVMAGAFAEVAKKMGAVEATVNLCLHVMPADGLLPGFFIAGCLVSFCIGTSVGTIVALVPMAAVSAEAIGLSTPLMVASVVGGAFFGDNLSFISDTTVVATRTQKCNMSDKFRANLRIAIPAAVVALSLYIYLGRGATAIDLPPIAWRDALEMLPYVAIIILALSGLSVIIVLNIGLLLAVIVGCSIGAFTLQDGMQAAADGISQMSDLILVSMMAGGLFGIIKAGGGITYLLYLLRRSISTRRSAELGMVLLTGLANLCTANNTVAILSIGPIIRKLAQRFDISPRRAASITDTSSCCVQGMLPYGAQLLMAGGLAALSPTAIMRFLFYPMLLFGVLLLSIFIVKKPKQ